MGDIGGFGAQSVAKQTNRRRSLDQQRLLKMADPEVFLHNYRRLVPTYRNFFEQPIWDQSEAMRPDYLDDPDSWLMRLGPVREHRMQVGREREATRKAGIRRPMAATDQAKVMAMLGGQTQTEGLDADLARRGMGGSVAAEAMRGAVGASAASRRQEALSRFYEQAIAAAAEEAGMMQRGGMAAVGGVPMPQFAPSFGASMGDTAMQALSLYLMGGLGGGSVAVPG